MKKNSPEIWSIGGGKGGTGKSFISSALGFFLSENGGRTILIDGDLGGSNLHSFFGRDKIRGTLTDYFKNLSDLQGICSETGRSGLRFIAGDMGTINPKSVPFFRRTKFYRDISELECDHVIIDLGAGSVLNTIDTFLISDKKIVVTTPEITSIENLYLFVKKVLIRYISDLYNDKGFGKLVRNFWKGRDRSKQVESFSGFIEYLREIDPALKNEIDNDYKKMNFNLIVNQVKNREQEKSGISLCSILKKHFKVGSKFTGFINYDENFWKMIEKKEPVNEIWKSGEIKKSIERIGNSIKEAPVG